MKTKIINKIKKLKKEKNAIILTHCYQNIELDEISDFVGDSLGLSQKAAQTDADIIVFLGVYFMAETAKMLSPNKKVLLPNITSGCLMADMIDLNQIREFKHQHKNIPVACYINSTAEVKSEADVCVTSSNAIKVVKEMKSKEILFAPDTYLGTFVQKNLPEIKVITYPGYCPTHLRILPEDVLKMKKQYPKALVAAHPECHQEVWKLADFVGSTTQIMNFVKNSQNKEFIISTEKGVVDRLQRDIKDKKFYLISPKAICPNMKKHHLEDVLRALEKEEHEIFVNEKIAKKAIKSIDRMLEICKTTTK